MRGTDCFAHNHDHLVPLEDHHVWPLGYHGPNTAANRRKGCANTHSDTHYFLELLLKNNGKVTWTIARTYGMGVRKVATEGYYKVMQYAASLVPPDKP